MEVQQGIGGRDVIGAEGWERTGRGGKEYVKKMGRRWEEECEREADGKRTISERYEDQKRIRRRWQNE